MKEFGGNVQRIIPRLHFFSLSLSHKAEISSSAPIPLFWPKDSPQWLSGLRWLWTSTSRRVLCKPVSLMGPTLSQDTVVSPPRLVWVKDVFVFSYNLPSALVAEWPRSFTGYCGNTFVNRIPKWVGQKAYFGEEHFPAASAGDRTRGLRSRAWHMFYHWTLSLPRWLCSLSDACSTTELYPRLVDCSLSDMCSTTKLYPYPANSVRFLTCVLPLNFIPTPLTLFAFWHVFYHWTLSPPR